MSSSDVLANDGGALSGLSDFFFGGVLIGLSRVPYQDDPRRLPTR